MKLMEAMYLRERHSTHHNILMLSRYSTEKGGNKQILT